MIVSFLVGGATVSRAAAVLARQRRPLSTDGRTLTGVKSIAALRCRRRCPLFLLRRWHHELSNNMRMLGRTKGFDSSFTTLCHFHRLFSV